MTRPVRALLVLVLAALVALPVAAETWYESYHRAEEALAKEEWGDAVRHLNAALEAKPDSSAQERTYGLRFVDYFPYLKLGIAYHHLGQLDAAEQAFETERRQGEVERSDAARHELEHYQGLIAEAKAAAEARRQERAQQVVADRLAAALDLEQQGELDDALSALSEVLAVAPDNAEAEAAKLRVLAAIAERQRQQELDERHARLVAEGRTALDAGRHSQAASAFSKAIEIRPSSELEALLERAQQGLRAELEARQGEEQRQRLISDSLARASSLEAAGELAAALDEVQRVIALDRGNRQALALQARVIQAQAAAAETRSRETSVLQLMGEAESLLAEGRLAQALARANLVLDLEPANREASNLMNQAYARLNERLLATDDAPPAIAIDDLREIGPEGVAVQQVRSADLVLTGNVYDSTPVELQFLDQGRPVGRATVQTQEVQGGLWVTKFRFTHRIPAGTTAVNVVAVDEGGQQASEEYRVHFTVPFIRSVWFPVSIAGGVGCVILGLVGLRARRRRQLLQRRFNPYVAGAPILERQRFFGRQQLLDYVLRRIANNSVLLYGERRIGKTSFQHQLKSRLEGLDDPEHQFFPAFIDLQGTPEERFFATMATQVFHELAPQLDGLQPGAALDGDGYGHREFVKDIHQVIKALQTRTTKKVKLVLLIDEVDELNDYDPRVNQKLRSLFMRTFADSLVSVVSGVAIKKHWDREGSPWYNFFQEVEVKPLDQAEARALVEAPVRGVFRFEPGVVDEILRRTACKPYIIQRLCSGLVDRLHEDRRRTFTMADVATAAEAEGV